MDVAPLQHATFKQNQPLQSRSSKTFYSLYLRYILFLKLGKSC